MTNKIIIALCISNFRQGGAETQFWNLVRGLDRNKFVVHVIQLAYKQNVPQPINLPTATQIVTIRRKYRFDIYSIIEMATYLKKNNIQIIQSMLFMDNQFSRLAGSIAGTCIISSIRGEIRPILGRTKNWVEYRMQRLSTIITTNSNWLTEYLVKNGSKSNKLVTIYNGIDLNKFKTDKTSESLREKFSIPTEAIIIGIVARLHPMKDHRTFLKTIAHLQQLIPNIHAVIVGDGDLRIELEEYVHDLKLHGHVTFLGSIKTDISHIYKMLDVLLLTSQYGESFPNVILEAMSSGVPVVASNISAVSEIINHGVNGYMVDKQNIEQFTTRTLDIIQNDLLRKQFISNGLLTADNFTQAKMVSQYEELYQNSV